VWRRPAYRQLRSLQKSWRESELGLIGETAERLDRFFGAFAGATKALLLLDYDGTLAPFRVDRFRARPWAGVRDLLTGIQRQRRSRIVVVTGRPASEIAPLLAVASPLEVWGLHGAERLHTDGRRELAQLRPTTQAKLDELCAQLRRDSLGGLFEVKSNAAVMHWRGIPAGRAKAIEKRTRALFEPLAQLDGLALMEFESGLELRAGPEKGAAVRKLLNELKDDVPHPVAFLGDDLTDEAGFLAMKGHGLSALVRRKRRETAADVWLRPPGELRDFLSMWLQACRALRGD
jgi:trehalose 6-phosphate phosphatase